MVALANIHARLCLSLLRCGLATSGPALQDLYIKFFHEFFSSPQCVLSPEVFQLAAGLSWPGAVAIAEGGLQRTRFSNLTVLWESFLLFQSFIYCHILPATANPDQHGSLSLVDPLSKFGQILNNQCKIYISAA